MCYNCAVMNTTLEDDVSKEVSVNIDGEETRICFVDHQHGEMSVGYNGRMLSLATLSKLFVCLVGVFQTL